GKRILINADLADRRFGRQLPTREAVNVDLSAIGTRRGSGERLEVLLQFVRIVGESLQILAADHDSACVIGRVNLDLRSLFSLHLDLLFLHLDFQRNLDLFRLPRRYLDVLDARCEAAVSDRAALSPRWQ